MYIGNLIAGFVGQEFTSAAGITNWEKVWLVPCIGSVVCLVIFIALWRDSAGKVQEVDVVAENAASPGNPDEVSQTAV
jgi:hypothetical protein